jgi:signal transduction histidine kinase
MTLYRRNLLLGVVVALVSAAVVLVVVDRLQARNRLRLLDAVVEAHVVDIMRQACEEDPRWFLAGPRTGRPTMADRQMEDADVRLPRPRADEMPFEFFAYDESFVGTSPAAPRFPDEFRRLMRTASPERKLSGPYGSEAGPGLQVAVMTNWSPGPCAVLLFRQQPPSGQRIQQATVFCVAFLVCLLGAIATATPVAARVRRMSAAARKVVSDDYSGIVNAEGGDEIGSLGAVFNDTAAELRRKARDSREREEALQRYVEHSTLEIAEPLGALEASLAHLMAAHDQPGTREAVKEAHRLAMQMRNMNGVVRLRGVADTTPTEPVELAPLIGRLATSRGSLAQAAGVTVDTSRAATPVTVQADAVLMELAVANVLDNAIIYSRQGGQVRVELHAYEHGSRFRLLIADNGPGVTDEEFEGLTANRRFRGDESRTRRPGTRGLGLALAREVADRFSLQLDLRRPTDGGIEAEFSPRA